jgi:hypothetical protein
MVRNIFDIVEKVARITQMDKVAKFVAKASGDTSGGCSSCNKRKDTLNKRFPFKK